MLLGSRSRRRLAMMDDDEFMIFDDDDDDRWSGVDKTDYDDDGMMSDGENKLFYGIDSVVSSST